MNKLAQLQLAKELLAQEYLQKQAALDALVKQAFNTTLFGDLFPSRMVRRTPMYRFDPRSAALMEQDKARIAANSRKNWWQQIKKMMEDAGDYVDTAWKE